jgi:hypothetical protein
MSVLVTHMALVAGDFKPIAGTPRLADGRWSLFATTNTPAPGDAIEAELDIAPGDRILDLEPDAAIEQGFMLLELVERAPSGERRPLLRLDCTTPSAPRTFPVRRTVGPGGRVFLRIAAELAGLNRFVHGAIVRVVRGGS